MKSIRLEAYQMSKMKKRVPMFLFVLAMMVAMALPTFAAFVNTGANGYYLFRAPHNNRLYLNLYGNTSALQSRRLTMNLGFQRITINSEIYRCSIRNSQFRCSKDCCFCISITSLGRKIANQLSTILVNWDNI